MLFGRHWHLQGKNSFYKRTGKKPPSGTPDLNKFIKYIYPKLGFDIKNHKQGTLHYMLDDFNRNYYNNIIKHFDFDKFKSALEIDFQKVRKFMEIVRQTWIWFIETVGKIKFDPENDVYKEFLNEYTNIL
jgi:hypothetical protein